jgi:hypothetical protein
MLTEAVLTAPASDRRHAVLIRTAGVVIIMLSAGAALLPILGGTPGTFAVAALLIAAGIIEFLAGGVRHETSKLAMLAGAATTMAGLLFAFNTDGDLLPSVTVVTVWLLFRSVILLIMSRRAHGSVRTWLGLSAATDFGLSVVLLTGLSITTLVVMLFGPMPQLVTGFAWVLAASFVATGTMLLEVASCEAELHTVLNE